MLTLTFEVMPGQALHAAPRMREIEGDAVFFYFVPHWIVPKVITTFL
jgi:hypothetical protein